MLSLLKYNQYKNGEDPTSFITQSCLYPKKIRVSDSLGKSHEMYVPCGCCLVCQDKKRNEWVSRMSLHSLTHKYCYFVTLTYGSYNLYDYIRHPFKTDWELMKPRVSYSNYKHKEIVMPTLLRQEHLTKFLKRLRSLLKFNITYCAAGEYGEKYLRPHFHIIIWSDEPITYSDVASAWSYKCYVYADKDIRQFNGKQPRNKVFTFPIGRIDFHDLVSNGTLDFDATQNQSQLKAKHVFSYVAKYVAKRNVITSRLRDHILQEFNRFPEVSRYEEEEDNRNIIKSEMNYRTFCSAFGFDYNAHRTLAEPFTMKKFQKMTLSKFLRRSSYVVEEKLLEKSTLLRILKGFKQNALTSLNFMAKTLLSQVTFLSSLKMRNILSIIKKLLCSLFRILVTYFHVSVTFICTSLQIKACTIILRALLYHRHLTCINSAKKQFSPLPLYLYLVILPFTTLLLWIYLKVFNIIDTPKNMNLLNT